MHSGASKVFAHFTSRSDNMINNRVRKIPIFGTRSSYAFALYTSYVARNAFLFEWDNLECCVLVAVRGHKPYLFLEKLRFGLRYSHCIMINGIVFGGRGYYWMTCICDNCVVWPVFHNWLWNAAFVTLILSYAVCCTLVLKHIWNSMVYI